MQQQVQMISKYFLFGEAVLSPVAEVGPVEGAFPPSYMLARRGSKAGMSVVGCLGEFHAELMFELSM